MALGATMAIVDLSHIAERTWRIFHHYMGNLSHRTWAYAQITHTGRLFVNAIMGSAGAILDAVTDVPFMEEARRYFHHHFGIGANSPLGQGGDGGWTAQSGHTAFDAW